MPSPLRRTRPHHVVVVVGLVLLAAWSVWQAADTWRRAPGDGAVTTMFEVDGVDCPVWCSVRLTAAIDSLDGAEMTRLDRATRRLEIRHDPERQSRFDLLRAIESHGFSVRGEGRGR